MVRNSLSIIAQDRQTSRPIVIKTKVSVAFKAKFRHHVDIYDENGELTDRGFDLMTDTAENYADDEADRNEYCETHPEAWAENIDEPYEEETA